MHDLRISRKRSRYHKESSALKFEPPDWLRHHDIQSLMSSGVIRRTILHRRTATLDQGSTERIIKCDNGVRLQIFDFRHDIDTRRPLLIGIHGWHGCHDANYIRSAASILCNAGFDLIRLNLRDHGGSVHLNEGLFHSCLLEETLDAVRLLVDERQLPTGLFGFSLGGNFVLRIAARASQMGIPLYKAVALCPVMDPVATMHALNNGRWFYRWWFMAKWKQALAAKQAAFPYLYDFSDIMAMDSMTEMMRHLVDRYTDFPNLKSYLEGYNLTTGILDELKIPASILLAADDPVVPIESCRNLPSSPFIQTDITRYGSHCGYLVDYRLASWQDFYLLKQFRKMLQ